MNLLVKTFLFKQDSKPFFITADIDEAINTWVKENKCTIMEIKPIYIPKVEVILLVVLYLHNDENIDLFDDLTAKDSILDLTDFDPNPPIDAT